jgi:orotidine-5'-phosphate decarboxylase
MNSSPLILALDSTSIERCASLISETKDFIGIYKFGLEFFSTNGPEGVAQLKLLFPSMRVFLDLKLHDIPNTVGRASEGLKGLDVEYLTVHASGGKEMIEASVAALPQTRITAVTVLTSLDSEILGQIGISIPIDEVALRWARLAAAAGAKAIVASPHEVSILRKDLPREISLITPGIRPKRVEDDQKRIMTPSDALAAGSDFLVIGRPITAATDPALAARQIFESL